LCAVNGRYWPVPGSRFRRSSRLIFLNARQQQIEDALGELRVLYLPGRDRAKLRIAVQIPALSSGWQDSFRDLPAAEGDSAATPPLGAYRISVKQEPHGTASGYLNRNLQPGAILRPCAGRWRFGAST